MPREVRGTVFPGAEVRGCERPSLNVCKGVRTWRTRGGQKTTSRSWLSPTPCDCTQVRPGSKHLYLLDHFQSPREFFLVLDIHGRSSPSSYTLAASCRLVPALWSQQHNLKSVLWEKPTKRNLQCWAGHTVHGPSFCSCTICPPPSKLRHTRDTLLGMVGHSSCGSPDTAQTLHTVMVGYALSPKYSCCCPKA